jgi:methyltransferase (TIGR00027 family)
MVLRAAHQLIDDSPRILDDPVAVQLLDPETRQRISLPGSRVATAEARTLRAHVVIRSRFAEDCLADAAGRGVQQYLLLGAGYDTFAYRQPAWAHSLRIFEVDHPASQDAKRKRLEQCSIAIPTNLTYAPIDFEVDTLAAGLARAGFDPQLPTFVSCLGVLMYLTQQAAYSVFDFVHTLTPASEIVATFHSVRRDAPTTDSPLGQSAGAAGEPWLSHFDPF